MTHDEKMLKRARDKLERIRGEYTGETHRHLESAAARIVAVYEKRVQEGRRPSSQTE